MNANELADELLYRYADEGGNFYGDDIHKDVIEMLIQQQAEIEALKCGLESMVDEFRQLDLPYGSKAYTKATELLRRKNECD